MTTNYDGDCLPLQFRHMELDSFYPQLAYVTIYRSYSSTLSKPIDPQPVSSVYFDPLANSSSIGFAGIVANLAITSRFFSLLITLSSALTSARILK